MMKTSDNIHGGDATDRRSSRADLLLERLLNLDMCLVVAWMAYAVGTAIDNRAVVLALEVVLAAIVLTAAVMALARMGTAWQLFREEKRSAALWHIPTIAAAAVLLVLQMFLGVLKP